MAKEDSYHVKVWIQAKQRDMARRSLNYCLQCSDPKTEGSRSMPNEFQNPSAVPAIWAGRGPHVYSISGALIYSVPNNANSAKILNSNQIKGQIALVDRGEIPLISKVKLLQETGAVAVVIVDDGQCGNKLEERHCGLANGKGFAQYDREDLINRN
eukprot:CAMPEP_0206395854 /NCGR_PEP_ID=MMETSP0294-20121207/22399_1 /ASSEMBLY_ACC=CAM_ASM_000327 /TAXON_ID=39354 /ORGANISM="Heterosigma akashiwo, Strain CCMP2393" /LENGTH=155 /DNA_ID=CAMNT_0053850397 /DNA_START=42 /DNA_END=509 /DNA_ORIENTATION=-